MLKLRPYQAECVAATIEFIRKTPKSCVLKLPTSAGKSLIIAEIAKTITEMSGKKVLCTAPSKELIEQNSEKYRSFGNQCSIFSASLNKKSLRHDVVFGTPQTIINEVKKSNKFDSRFAAIIIDECQGITNSLKKIIEAMKSHNPYLRVIGLSATPYRMNDGYIYKTHATIGGLDESQAKNPYFDHCIFDLHEWDMIDNGYITRPIIGKHELAYDTSGLVVKSNGLYDQKTVDQAFLGKGRLTADIVADVVNQSTNRMAVMFFASSIAHAHEVLESLPYGNSKLITGDTDKREREKILNQFKGGEFKYLVNVSVLTTGFDAPNVDTIAILRATESPGLFIQIIGRGVRLHPDKKECLVLDYAENIGRVVYESDIFDPVIKVKGVNPGVRYEFVCPSCQWVNNFALNKEFEGANYDKHGYLKNELMGEDAEPKVVHLGQRCQAVNHLGAQSCDYYWSSKECTECGAQNSLSARYCKTCNAELIDPNEKLTLIASIAETVNPYEWREIEVTKALISVENDKGNCRVDYYVKDRKTALINDFVNPNHSSGFFKLKSVKAINAMGLELESLPRVIVYNEPIKIKYRKRPGGQFFEIEYPN